MKTKNAILFSNVDREDYWVSNGLVFKVENTDTYIDAYNEIKEKLESKEVIDYLIEEACLIEDLFDGDETYKLVKTEYIHRLYLTFENESGEQVEHRMSADFVFSI